MIKQSPFIYMENSIAAKLETDLQLKTIVIPDEITGRTKNDQHLTIAWERISNVKRLDGVFTEADCLFSFTIEFKEIRHTGQAKNVLWWAVKSLTNFRPFNQFDPLTLVTGGYVGYNEAIGFIKYSAQFQSSFIWNTIDDFELKEYPQNIYTEQPIDLSLWDAPQLPSADQAVLVEEIK